MINNFETILKKYKSLYFNKVYEKHNNGWKLIYNIQGLNIDNFFYPNLKFILWLDEDKKEIIENVISFLYSAWCDYKSESFDENNIEEVFNKILQYIREEQTNKDLYDFIINGTKNINKLLKEKNIPEFVQHITYVPHKDKSCIDTKFIFEIESNKKKDTIYLKSYKTYWTLSYNEINENIDFNNIYKKLITLIYETN